MSKHKKTAPLGVLLMLLAAISTATGQLLWKMSDTLLDLPMLGGFVLYGMGAVLMTAAFRYGRLSVLHPLLSVGYVIAIFYGAIFLDETITLNVSVGTFLILIGVIVIGGDSD